MQLWRWEEPRQAQRPLREFQGSPGYLALSADGHWLASSVIPVRVSRLLLWNLRQEEPQPRQLNAGDDLILALAFHPDGNLLVTGDREGNAKRWRLPEAETGDVVGTLDGPVLALANSPDGRYLAMAGCANFMSRPIYYVVNCSDAQLDVLDRESGRLLARPFHGHSRAILSLAFNQDGSVLASGDLGGDIILWDLTATPEELACRRAGRNLTGAEWERYFGAEPYRQTCPELPVASN